MNIIELTELIQKRRSVFPPTYNGKEIEREKIMQILENANWSPTHKMTEPWRFKILRGDALKRLSDFMVADYKMQFSIDKQSPNKLKKIKNNPLQSSTVIAICMHRNEVLPEWEEVAAVAMAVQNMWLSCTALGIGAYWSTPGSIVHMDDLLNLGDEEKCLGLFYMGYTDMPLHEGKRKSIEDKTVWLDK
jgi:nitroreductase